METFWNIDYDGWSLLTTTVYLCEDLCCSCLFSLWVSVLPMLLGTGLCHLSLLVSIFLSLRSVLRSLMFMCPHKPVCSGGQHVHWNLDVCVYMTISLVQPGEAALFLTGTKDWSPLGGILFVFQLHLLWFDLSRQKNLILDWFSLSF